MAAGKLRLAFAVGLLAMSTHWTCAASVSGIHKNNRHSGQLGLIFYKQPKLAKSPSVEPGSLLPPNRSPFADTLEILKGYRATSAFGGGNDILTDTVVHVAAKTSFIATYPYKVSLGAARAAALQASSEIREPFATGFDGIPGVRAAIRIGGKADHAKINAHGILWFYGCAVGQVNGDVQKELTTILAVNKIGLAFNPATSLLLILAKNTGQQQPAGEGVDANPILALERQDSIIVYNRGVWLERRAYLLVTLKGLDSLADGAHGELGGEAVLQSDLGIAALVDGGLREDLGLKGNPGGEGRRRVEFLHGLEKGVFFLSGGDEFNLQGQLHTCTLRRVGSLVKGILKKGAALPLSPEGDSLRAVNL